MPIEPSTPPIAAYEVVRARLAQLAMTGAFRTPRLRRASSAALALALPHRVAQVPLDRIKGGASLRSTAADQGWRFLVLDGDRVVAVATAIQDKAGEYRFGFLNEGPFVGGTETAVRQAEGADIVQQGHFEPLLLLVPALYVVGLWLQDRAGEADLVVPMNPAPRALSISGLFPVAGFWEILVRLADQRPPEPPPETAVPATG